MGGYPEIDASGPTTGIVSLVDGRAINRTDNQSLDQRIVQTSAPSQY
jgi:hypothetical protein